MKKLFRELKLRAKFGFTRSYLPIHLRNLIPAELKEFTKGIIFITEDQLDILFEEYSEVISEYGKKQLLESCGTYINTGRADYPNIIKLRDFNTYGALSTLIHELTHARQVTLGKILYAKESKEMLFDIYQKEYKDDDLLSYKTSPNEMEATYMQYKYNSICNNVLKSMEEIYKV